MTELIKELKPLIDLGVAGLVLGALFLVVMRPPKWIVDVVGAHHELAVGVQKLGDAVAGMPKREEIQELLIGQEALRRESEATRSELSGIHQVLRDLRSPSDGHRG